ncbi:bifunctional helix-turn-helix transcriptional regulator/GNAT family N-acetyltransferase [Tsukamurella ocularis]|uniref:bifunctional helix-turn-helix transcriptional regulator/GNAT family N-acetyltransferase n=1 Tax=Tsukamurella ocularis TaxID=1970234 RepID=UPI00216A3455|nr:helix-turn-helix domain-containing GNAT family N-acetyltransferase [Tsukamurella ocularis]MCS3782094.1 DNA-binding MarR family transcriptional regulator/predicted GNAT family N-acyltransferase [Tsukamurella ocularis]MCS3789746.1 DNA-binding MarR family transcriptional regulator/predicted GNAT family N-acyltransferase [Tsukamurella ocularis]MCS3852893.1 DNA-binding MarR family transcriptional regulator/predicted GNAT family N-acyltransferase [Tsukamurella ocularis]
MSEQVEQVRRFNRAVTQRLGVLQDQYLARDRPLGQARLLWEVGRSAGGIGVRELRTRLDLDSGYLSRLLRALEADGLVTVGQDDGDGRARTARVTPAGAAEYAELESRSNDAAHALLGPLSDGQRGRLVAAMAEVERLLVASLVRVDEVDAMSAAAQFAARAYYAELGQRLQDGFDPGLGGAVRDAAITPPAGLLLVATLRAETVGCGALAFQDGGFAEVKRVWAAPSVRGLGLGRRIMADLEDRARAAGARTVRLDTNGNLTEAIGLYRKLGYREVERYNDNPYAHHWFAKDL